MRVALMIEGQEGVTWDQWVGLARACEESGVEALFRSDHYLGIVGGVAQASLDAWTTLAGLAAVTERVRLGTLVSPVTFRHAAVLAKSAVTVDHISGGRVEVGVGAGWFAVEHEVYGFPFLSARERVTKLREDVELIVRGWTEDDRVWPKPVQQPHPPLIIGGGAKPGTVRPAVRWATEYNTHGVSPEACRERRETLDRACAAAGRDPASLLLSVMQTVVVGADEQDLRERAGRFLARVGRGEAADDYLDGLGPDELIGTVDEVARRLRAYEDAGVTRIMCQHLLHEDLEMVHLLGRELAPRIAS